MHHEVVRARPRERQDIAEQCPRASTGARCSGAQAILRTRSVPLLSGQLYRSVCPEHRISQRLERLAPNGRHNAAIDSDDGSNRGAVPLFAPLGTRALPSRTRFFRHELSKMCLSRNSQSAGPLKRNDSFRLRPESRTCLKIQLRFRLAAGHEKGRSGQVTGRPAQKMHVVATISEI